MRPSSPAIGSIAIGLPLNLVILLSPAAWMDIGRGAWGADIGLFLIGASALCLADLAGLGPRRGAAVVAPPGSRVLGLAWAQGLALLAVFWTGLVQRLSDGTPGLPASVEVLGLVLMLTGALLRYAAIRTLGARFVTEIEAGPELVRRGVYDRIRHPSETGLLLAAMGSALLLSSPAALGVFVVLLLPVVISRTRIEDAALATSFGERHLRYVREAGRFLPVLRSR